MSGPIDRHGDTGPVYEYRPDQGQVTGSADAALLSIHQDMMSQSDTGKQITSRLSEHIGTPDKPVLKAKWHYETEVKKVQVRLVGDVYVTKKEKVKVRVYDELPTPDLKAACYTGYAKGSEASIEALKGQIEMTAGLGGLASAASLVVPKPQYYAPLLTGKKAEGADHKKLSKKEQAKADKKAAAAEAERFANAPKDSAEWLYLKTKIAADADAKAKAAAAKDAAKAKAKEDKLKARQAKINGKAQPDTSDTLPGHKKATGKGTSSTSNVDKTASVDGVHTVAGVQAGLVPGVVPVNASTQVQNNVAFSNSLTATHNTLRIVGAQVDAMATTNPEAATLSAFLKAISTAISHLKEFLGWLAKADLKTHMGQNKNAGSDAAHVTLHKVQEGLKKIRAMQRIAAIVGAIFFFLGPLIHAIITMIMKAIMGMPLTLKTVVGDTISNMMDPFAMINGFLAIKNPNLKIDMNWNPVNFVVNAITDPQFDPKKAIETMAMAALSLGGTVVMDELTQVMNTVSGKTTDPNQDPVMDYHYNGGAPYNSAGAPGGGHVDKTPTQSIAVHATQEINRATYSPEANQKPVAETASSLLSASPLLTAQAANDITGLIATAACLGPQGLTLGAMAGVVVDGTSNLINGTRGGAMQACLGTTGLGAPHSNPDAVPGTAASLFGNMPVVGDQYRAAGDSMEARLSVAASALGAAGLPVSTLGTQGFTIAAAAALAVTGAVLDDGTHKSITDRIAGVERGGGGGGGGGPGNVQQSPEARAGATIAVAAAAAASAHKIAKDNGMEEDVAELIAQITKLLALLMQLLSAAKGGGEAPGHIQTDAMKSCVQKLVEANVGGDGMSEALACAEKGDMEGMMQNVIKCFSTAGMDPQTLTNMGKAVMGDFNIQSIQPKSSGGASYSPLMAA